MGTVQTNDAVPPADRRRAARGSRRVSRRAVIVGGGLAGLGLFGAVTSYAQPIPDLGRPAGSPHKFKDAAIKSTGASGSGGSEDSGASSGSDKSDDGDSNGGDSDKASDDSSQKMRTFVSTDLTVPEVSSSRQGPVTPGLLFVGQKTDDYDGLIMEESGEPVWIEPTGATVTDLRVQRFRGEPVLTYWAGTITSGHGYGEGRILDSSYRLVATVRTSVGIDADLHEFNLTDAGTALLTSYPTVPADLTSIGGPVDGYIYDCRAQEVDVATGRVLLDWSALEHIGVDESYKAPDDDDKHDGTDPEHAFDPYHLNAIDDDGDRLFLSMRHTHTIYTIGRASGDIHWRLGGKRSDFDIPADAAFAWQHDVRHHDDGTVSLFDNHEIDSDSDAQSRGLLFALDEESRKATLLMRYASDGYLATAMGSTQMLPNGHALLGWGTSAHVTEFDCDGKPVYEADLGGITYRAARHEWTATPRTRPDVAAQRTSTDVRVYLSWNGATEVARWRISAGDSWFDLKYAATVTRSGFETVARIDLASVVTAEALDAAGAVLGSTEKIGV